ncbi:MAG: hypothetical protein EU544_03545 [Promethearchaeota archaeon]|nr:MAG: hypothetical protein EU544_03545 [Candidatus Lokiarchaeota archaeon]
MPDKKVLLRCAEAIVDCMDIRKEDTVLLGGGEHSLKLFDQVRSLISRIGAVQNLYLLTDEYGRNLFQDTHISIETLEKTPLYFDYLKEKATMFIYTDWFSDPSILSEAPKEKRVAWSKAKAPIRQLLHHGINLEDTIGERKNVKWLYFYWPSEAFAKFNNIEYQDLEQTVVNGITVQKDLLNQNAQKLMNKLENIAKLHVSDEYGSDFWISTKHRPIYKEIGRIACEQRGVNLPAGEIYLPPIETKGEGVLFCPITNDKKSNKIIRNVELPFKNGQLELDKVSADSNLDALIDSFQQCEQLDRENKNIKTLRTYNIGEFGLGINPNIKQAIGYQLIDEKIYSAVHLAFGWNDSFGGTSISDMHWDFVSSPQCTINAEYLDGSQKTIMEKGVIMA